MQQLLLAWYSQNGRDLPWRHTHDPYAILVSEVMLQQTQVSRVVPRYLAWLERWPNAAALAAATPAEVIEAWSGLGYNRRAVNLHRCAQAVAERGGFPRDQAQLRALPGIGPYTAAAIACFAFGAAGGRSRRQRPPRARPRLRRPRTAATARPRLRVEPGPVRPGQRHLHRPPPALPALPAGGRLPVGRHDLRRRCASSPVSRDRSASAEAPYSSGWWRRGAWTLPSWTTVRRWTRWSPTAWPRCPAASPPCPVSGLPAACRPDPAARAATRSRRPAGRPPAPAAATGSATPPSIP